MKGELGKIPFKLGRKGMRVKFSNRNILPLLTVGLMLLLVPVALCQTTLSQVTLKFTKDGQPLSNILVEVYSNDTLIFKGFSDSQGQIVLTNILEGEYLVKCYLKNDFLGTLIEYRFTVNITGSQTTYEFDLSLGSSITKINWRPILIVAGLGILGFLILFGVGMGVSKRGRL